MKLCRKWVKTLIYFCKKFHHRFLTEFQVNSKLGLSYVGIRRLRKVVVTNMWLYKGRVPIRLAVVSVENGLLQNFFRLYCLWKLKTIRIIKAMFSCEMYYNIYGKKVPVKLICFQEVIWLQKARGRNWKVRWLVCLLRICVATHNAL